MNPLPPLLTVRTAGQAREAGTIVSQTPAPIRAQAPAPACAAPAPEPAAPAAPVPEFSSPGLPTPARVLFQQVIDLRLADAADVRGFVEKSVDKLTGLTTRERAGQALAHAGLLTAYQCDRLIAGNAAGLVLGSYRVLERIGGGSVGVVFLGEHMLLRRRVAIKVLPVDDDVSTDLIGRFRGEMRLLAGIDHPHVVTAHDAGTAAVPGQTLHYLVLELVSGGDLEQFVYDRGPQPVSRACEWGRQAASGLQAAHDRHLVHRDLKPSNLLLTADRRVKLIDFGLARQLASSTTANRAVLGSVDFMSPEQSLDPTAVGPAADVYGLGATLFWVVSGQLPVARGETLGETVRALATAKPRRLREFLPNAPEALDNLLGWMLARDPADRPSAVEVMNELAPLAAAAADLGGSDVIRLRETVRQLHGTVTAKDAAVRKAEGAVLYAMAKMAESHDGETEGHLHRMQEYVRLLVPRLADRPEWAMLADRGYVADLLRCVPLHDIGKIGLPDAVMNKPGALTPEERAVVEVHPLSGVAILGALGREHGESLTFLGVARAVVRNHHERWDGTGYPDRFAGEDIPPVARLVALADTYDALRRDRPHRTGLSHAEAAHTILATAGQFDPAVLDAFQTCEKQFDEVWATIPN